MITETSCFYPNTLSNVSSDISLPLSSNAFGHRFTSSPPTKRKRTSRACVNCFRKKTRCDENRPCGRCVKRGKTTTCVNREVKKSRMSNNSSSPSLKRKNVSNACVNCIRAKAKCNEHRPCDRCVRKTIHCLDRETKKGQLRSKSGSSRSQLPFSITSPSSAFRSLSSVQPTSSTNPKQIMSGKCKNCANKEKENEELKKRVAALTVQNLRMCRYSTEHIAPIQGISSFVDQPMPVLQHHQGQVNHSMRTRSDEMKVNETFKRQRLTMLSQ